MGKEFGLFKKGWDWVRGIGIEDGELGLLKKGWDWVRRVGIKGRDLGDC